MKQKTNLREKQKRSIERKVRLTPKEYEMFRKKSERYHTMAGMIRDAVRLFDDKATKRKLESVTEVKNFYIRFDQRLGWIGSNLNQAQHRANELAIEGQLSADYIQQILEPRVGETLQLIREMRSNLEKLRQHLLKL
jgi:hypothetical protein